jgi:hypothetical protein
MKWVSNFAFETRLPFYAEWGKQAERSLPAMRRAEAKSQMYTGRPGFAPILLRCSAAAKHSTKLNLVHYRAIINEVVLHLVDRCHGKAGF